MKTRGRFRKRGKISRWLVETTNVKTGKVSSRKVKKTYDEITELVDATRNRNRFVSVCATELHSNGTPMFDGKVVAECSIDEERSLSMSKKDLSLKDVLIEPDPLDYL